MDRPTQKSSAPYADLLDHPLLSAEDERALTEALRDGRRAAEALREEGLGEFERRWLERKVREGEAARETLVLSNLRFVHWVAKEDRFARPGFDLEDRFLEGVAGLLQALDRFDPDTGNRLSTYLKPAIERAIYRAGDHAARTIRLPENVEWEIRKLDAAGTALTKQLGRLPTVEELAEKAGVDPARVEQTQQWRRPTGSLDVRAGDRGTASRGTLIPDPVDDVGRRVDRIAMSEVVTTLIAMLGEEEARIVDLAYGLSDDEPRTMQEIAEIVGRPRSTVHKFLSRALAVLRHPGLGVEDVLHHMAA